MRSESLVPSYFDSLAETYAATQRLSPHCAALLVSDIVRRVPRHTKAPLADIGCGDAYLSSMLLLRAGFSHCILLDNSAGMLTRARRRIARSPGLDRVSLIRADACALPLRSESMGVVMMAFVFHILREPKSVLMAVDRVLAPDGWFFLVTYDPDDLAHSIYHRYFPGYRDIDSRRFVAVPRLIRLLSRCRFNNIESSRYPYQIRFRSVEDAVNMVKSRPFSAMASYVDDAFSVALKEFESNLRQCFGQGTVTYRSHITVLSMTKSGNRLA